MPKSKTAVRKASKPAETKHYFFERRFPHRNLLFFSTLILVLISAYLIAGKINRQIFFEQRKHQVLLDFAETLRQERLQPLKKKLLKGRILSGYTCDENYCVDIIEDISQQQITLLLPELIEYIESDIVDKDISVECRDISPDKCEVKSRRTVSIQSDEPIYTEDISVLE